MPSKAPRKAPVKKAATSPTSKRSQLTKLASLKAKLAKLSEQRAVMARATEDFTEASERFIAAMQQAGATEVVVDLDDDVRVKTTLVESNATNVDYDLLRELLTDAEWNMVTERKVNLNLLRDAVSQGRIDHSVLDEVMTTAPRKPYLRWS